LSRTEEDGRTWLRRPELRIKSCRAIIRKCVPLLEVFHVSIEVRIKYSAPEWLLPPVLKLPCIFSIFTGNRYVV
jgi:hypothetical protein